MTKKSFLYNIDTKYPIGKHTGEFGVNRCDEFFRRLGWIPTVIHQENDVGLDMIVEIAEKQGNNVIPHGYQVGIQIKAGKSYYYKNKKGDKYFILTKSEEHKRNWDYWATNSIPVFIFFYFDDLNVCSFLSIDEWANSREKWKVDEPLPIKSHNLFKYNEIQVKLSEFIRSFEEEL